VEYGGTHARQSDLYGTQDAVVKITKTFFKVSMLMKTASLLSCDMSDVQQNSVWDPRYPGFFQVNKTQHF
jgi:hypothetical protein